jgi:hypothetical protein
MTSSLLYSQSQCTQCNWDWTNWSYTPGNSNWDFISAGGNGVQDPGTGSPWAGSVPAINTIYNYNDYTIANGWVLLYKDFGCYAGTNYPYFILYNKYTGKMRLFLYLYMGFDQNPLNKALVKLKWNDPTLSTSLLSLSNANYYANSNYHATSYISDDVGTYVLNNADQNLIKNNFFVADFNMAFDPQTPRLTNYQLNFDIETLTKYDITLAGTFDWTTRSIGANESLGDQNTSTDNSKTPPITTTDYIYNTVKTIPKVTASLPSASDLEKVFVNQNTQLATFQSNSSLTIDNIKIVSDFKQSMTDLSNSTNNDFESFMKTSSNVLPVVGKYLTTALSVYDYFSGKAVSSPTQVSIMPTVTHGTINLSGSMSAQTAISSIIFDIPGSAHNPQSNKTPLWDCPLGVISLQDDPSTSYSSGNPGISKQKVMLYDGEKFDHIEYTHDQYTHVTGAKVITKPDYVAYKNLRINNDFKFNLNPTSGATIISLKAAIVGRVPAQVDAKGIAKPIITPFIDKKYDPIYPYNSGDNSATYPGNYGSTIDYYPECSGGNQLSYINTLYNCIPVTGTMPWYIEPFNDYAYRGDYFLNNIDENGIFEVSTPFIDVTKFKGTSITLPEQMEVYVKVIAVLQPTDLTASQTPIVLSMKYKVNEPDYNDNTSTVNYATYPYTNEEFNNMNLHTLTVKRSSTITSGNLHDWDIITNGNLNVNASQSDVNFMAYRSVILQPGFTATPSASYKFTASIDDPINNNINVPDITTIPTNTTPLSSIVSSNFNLGPNQDNNCKCSTQKSARLEEDNSFDNLVKTSVEVANLKNGPKVYPTLTSGKVTIDNISHKYSKSLIVQVFNTVGKVVIYKATDQISTSIDLTDFSNGLYIIKLIQEGNVKSFKIIKN